MIDLHSHVLHGIDDGPGSIEESLQLLASAVRNGIDTIVATPHYNHYYTNEKDVVLAQLEKLEQAIEAHNLPIKLLPGQEIWIHETLPEHYKAGKLLTLADSRYMLIEFPPEEIPHYTEQLFYEFERLGIKAIIAHPERNVAFFESPDKLYRLLQKGALTQLTSASISGMFGKRVQAFSHELIEANWVHFVATDAHDMEKRPFYLSDAYRMISQEYGEEQLHYFKENARMVIEDKPLHPRDAKQIVRKKRFGIF